MPRLRTFSKVIYDLTQQTKKKEDASLESMAGLDIRTINSSLVLRIDSIDSVVRGDSSGIYYVRDPADLYVDDAIVAGFFVAR
jgi:hypothetical protein